MSAPSIYNVLSSNHQLRGIGRMVKRLGLSPSEEAAYKVELASAYAETIREHEASKAPWNGQILLLQEEASALATLTNEQLEALPVRGFSPRGPG